MKREQIAEAIYTDLLRQTSGKFETKDNPYLNLGEYELFCSDSNASIDCLDLADAVLSLMK